MESGLYMTSFAAAIFIGALLTFGVLVITLLIALTVMLQSCQSKSAGVVELQKFGDDYNFCKIYVMHAELNSLSADSVPAFCNDVAVQYIEKGLYMKDLNLTVSMAEHYFSNVKLLDDGLDVVLMDVDDFSSDSCDNIALLLRLNQDDSNDFIKDAKRMKDTRFLQLYMRLQAGGWSLILLSRKPEKLRNVTIQHLISCGFGGWTSLVMRLDSEMQLSTREYLSRRRIAIQEEGFRIASVISSQMEALTGPSLGKRIFKLPNPIYYDVEYHNESTYILQKNTESKEYHHDI
ncbi:hypothetical protein RJ639_044264 [Escallonia herrerae]|uniref:Uncharacterized protein n=1 Tax=Escallonia herrerae TaxID=1293975 RepID=A0AA88WD90_9ASTE|nr:hypothetical protein RJ639_044264 [Escallonia herrerae]